MQKIIFYNQCEDGKKTDKHENWKKRNMNQNEKRLINKTTECNQKIY